MKSKFREYTEAIIIAILLAVLIRTFAVQAFKIPSGSMIPTLSIGDHILVNKFLYGLRLPFTESRFFILRPPRRGDIVVFSFPANKEKKECTSFNRNVVSRLGSVWMNRNPFLLFKDDCRDFIKRIVGVGGDTVTIKNKTVYVNGIALDESYIIHRDKLMLQRIAGSRDNLGPLQVPRGKFFVMGDNRDQSYDSRFWGMVDINEIKGKAFIIYWSWDSEASLLGKIRWGRIGDILH
jgi:signal peptidase I